MRPIFFSLLMAGAVVIGTVPETEAQVRLGPKGGLSFGTVSVENAVVDGHSYRTGFALGGAVEVPLTGRFRLQFEPSYVQRGMELDWGDAFGDLYTVAMFDYVTLPILAKVDLDTGSLSPYVLVGPSLALIVSERVYDSVTELTRSKDGLVRDFDVTAEIEAGVEVPLNVRAGTALSLGARYSLGVADISAVREAGGGDTRGGGSVRSRGLLVLVGFLIPL